MAPSYAIRLRSQSRLRSTGVALAPSWNPRCAVSSNAASSPMVSPADREVAAALGAAIEQIERLLARRGLSIHGGSDNAHDEGHSFAASVCRQSPSRRPRPGPRLRGRMTSSTWPRGARRPVLWGAPVRALCDPGLFGRPGASSCAARIAQPVRALVPLARLATAAQLGGRPRLLVPRRRRTPGRHRVRGSRRSRCTGLPLGVVLLLLIGSRAIPVPACARSVETDRVMCARLRGANHIFAAVRAVAFLRLFEEPRVHEEHGTTAATAESDHRTISVRLAVSPVLWNIARWHA